MVLSGCPGHSAPALNRTNFAGSIVYKVQRHVQSMHSLPVSDRQSSKTGAIFGITPVTAIQSPTDYPPSKETVMRPITVSCALAALVFVGLASSWADDGKFKYPQTR